MITLTRAQAIAMIRDALRHSGWDLSDGSWLGDAIKVLEDTRDGSLMTGIGLVANPQIFRTGEYLLWEGELHRVICADEETAVLAPSRHYPGEGRTNTDYTKLFAVSNRPELYETIADRVTRVDDDLPLRPEVSE